MKETKQDTILIVDFGSQYTKLIARRLREGSYYSLVVSCNSFLSSGLLYKSAESAQKNEQIKGIILAGSHRSVTPQDEKLVAHISKIYQTPILGICYGMQLLAKINGGKVTKGEQGEYGYGKIVQKHASRLLSPKISDVWLSHGDEVTQLPADFVCTAKTEDGLIAAFESIKDNIYGLQFHPEVTHSIHGSEILWRFAKICDSKQNWQSGNIINGIIDEMRAKISQDNKTKEEGKEDWAILALSGGVDSSVMAVLAQKVFGKKILPLFIDNGLLRKDEGDYVEASLKKIGVPVIRIDAAAEFLAALAGVSEPEEKRKIIGKLFIEIFERESTKLLKDKRKRQHKDNLRLWLVQGTIYPDVIESAGDQVSAAQVIKSHHNVGGLPADMSLSLWEPLRMLFKDEVRKIGKELGMPQDLLGRHPFPGPGLGVRVLGEVKKEYLEILRAADAIFIEELKAHNYYDEISQAFSVFIPLRSVGVIGDARSYGYIIALRAVTTEDFMTAAVAKLPEDFLAGVASKIMNQIPQVTRVVYDYSSKPPATIEWE